MVSIATVEFVFDQHNRVHILQYQLGFNLHHCKGNSIKGRSYGGSPAWDLHTQWSVQEALSPKLHYTNNHMPTNQIDRGQGLVKSHTVSSTMAHADLRLPHPQAVPSRHYLTGSSSFLLALPMHVLMWCVGVSYSTVHWDISACS